MKISRERLKEIIQESLEEWTKAQVKTILADEGPGPEQSEFFAGRPDASPEQSLREPWDGIEENAERLDILSNQVGGLTSKFEQLLKLLAP